MVKKLLFVVFICLLQNSLLATNYYIAANGSSSNTGTSAAFPWPFSKVNSFTFSTGDNVYFNRGDSWYGEIIVNQSGVTYDAYGTGAKPIITGLSSLNSWTNIGGNIWETTSAVSTLPNCTFLLVNGVSVPMGRYPNTGWIPYQSHNTNTSVTTTGIDGSTDWTGANLVVKMERWFAAVSPITSQVSAGASGYTLNFNYTGTYNLKDNWSFFIENDIRTLDQQNEWYFNPSTKKIDIYSTSTPSGVQIPTLQNCFQDSANYNNITVKNINFIGANAAVMDFNFAQNVYVQSNTVFYGARGIYVNGYAPVISSNTVWYTVWEGIHSDQNGDNGIIQSNDVEFSRLIEGTNYPDGASALYVRGTNLLTQYNTVKNSGWTAINVRGTNSLTKNNFVDSFAITDDDAGGIAIDHIQNGAHLENNIVLHGIGNTDGTSDAGTPLANGIYFDDLSQGISAIGNTVAWCNGVGQFVHRANSDTITNNKYYSNGVLNNWTNGEIFFHYGSEPIQNMDIQNNQFVSTNSGQNVLKFYSDPLQGFDNSPGVMDYNFFYNLQTTTSFVISNPTSGNYALSDWQSQSKGFDLHSTVTPAKVPSTSDSIKLVYNASPSAQTTTLPYKYVEIQSGTVYDGSITLQPYTSAILVQNGTATGTASAALTTVFASGDRSVTATTTNLTTTVTISGVLAKGVTGTGNTYQWSQVSGGSATIASPTSLKTQVSGLQDGVYLFKIVATNNGVPSIPQQTKVTIHKKH